MRRGFIGSELKNIIIVLIVIFVVGTLIFNAGNLIMSTISGWNPFQEEKEFEPFTPGEDQYTAVETAKNSAEALRCALNSLGNNDTYAPCARTAPVEDPQRCSGLEGEVALFGQTCLQCNDEGCQLSNFRLPQKGVELDQPRFLLYYEAKFPTAPVGGKDDLVLHDSEENTTWTYPLSVDIYPGHDPGLSRLGLVSPCVSAITIGRHVCNCDLQPGDLVHNATAQPFRTTEEVEGIEITADTDDPNSPSITITETMPGDSVKECRFDGFGEEPGTYEWYRPRRDKIPFINAIFDNYAGTASVSCATTSTYRLYSGEALPHHEYNYCSPEASGTEWPGERYEPPIVQQ